MSRTVGYVQPFAELEPHEWLAGTREVWTSTHGRAGRYHVMVDDGMAACRPAPYLHGKVNGVLLYEPSLAPLDEVASYMRCQRAACRRLFTKATGT